MSAHWYKISILLIKVPFLQDTFSKTKLFWAKKKTLFWTLIFCYIVSTIAGKECWKGKEYDLIHY